MKAWLGKRLLFWLFLTIAIAVAAWGFVLSQPWALDDPSFRVGLLQTFVTIAALVLAIPAALAAWEAYRLATVRVPIRVTLQDPTGHMWRDPMVLLLENKGEVEAKGFVVQLLFGRELDPEQVTTLWPGAEASFIFDPVDPSVGAYGVNYVFFESFGRSGPETLLTLWLDQMEYATRNPKPLSLRWQVRGGNAVRAGGELVWSPE